MLVAPETAKCLETWSFENFLDAFSESSIIYSHLSSQRYTNMTLELELQHKHHSASEFFANLRQNFKTKAHLQFVILTNGSQTLSKIKRSKTGDFQAIILKKFSECSVLILQREYLGSTNQLILHNSSYRIQSEFIWFLTSPSKLARNSENNYKHLLNVRGAFIYFEIDNFTDVSYICIPCSEKGKSSSREESHVKVRGTESITILRKAWEILHLKMHQSLFAADFANTDAYFHKGQSAPCSSYPRKTDEYYSHHCMLIVVTKRCNFTMVKFGSIQASPIHSEIREVIVSSKINPNFKYVVLHYGSSNPMFGFIVMYHKTEMRISLIKLEGIMAPFPWWVWVCIAMVTFVTSSLSIDEMKQAVYLTFLNAFYSCFLFSSVILDQGTSELPRNKNLCKFVLWSAWGIFSLIVSNGYRGFLFSSLAIEVDPQSPQNLEELVKSEMLIGTTQSFYNSKTETWGNVMSDCILPPLISFKKTSNKTKEIYQKLQTSLKLFDYPDHISTVVIGASVNRSVWEDDGINITSITVPEKFALLDVDDDNYINLFKTLFEDANNFWVSRPIMEPRFTTKMILMTPNNYLNPIIGLSLAKLHESGMYNWWEKFDNSYFQKFQRQRVINMTQNVSQLHINTAKEYEVSKTVYLNILIFYSEFVGSTLVVFVLEISYKNIWSRIASRSQTEVWYYIKCCY